MVTPRLHLLESDETVSWRSLLVLRQSLGADGELFTSLEYGAENQYWRNPFRVHQFYWRQQFGSTRLTVGRIAQWNALRNLRVDGGEILLKSQHLGRVRVLAGVKAVTDFSDTAFTDYPEWAVSWAKGSWGRSLEVSMWSEYLGQTQRSFAGVTYQWKLFGWNYGQALSYDLTENHINHLRARFSKNIGPRSWAFGFRQKRYVTGDVYPWTDEPVHIAPTAFLEVRRQRGQVQTWNQWSYRFQNDLTLLWISSIEKQGLVASMIAGKRDQSTLLGWTLGYRKSLFHNLTADMTAGIHYVGYGEVEEPSPSSALTGRVLWEPRSGIQFIFFGRFAQNPFYKVDSRGGITIHVSI